MLRDIMHKVMSESYFRTTITSDMQSLRSRQDGLGDLRGPLLFLPMNHFNIGTSLCVFVWWWLQCVLGLPGQQLSHLNPIPFSASEMWRKSCRRTEAKFDRREMKWSEKSKSLSIEVWDWSQYCFGPLSIGIAKSNKYTNNSQLIWTLSNWPGNAVSPPGSPGIAKFLSESDGISGAFRSAITVYPFLQTCMCASMTSDNQGNLDTSVCSSHGLNFTRPLKKRHKSLRSCSTCSWLEKTSRMDESLHHLAISFH